ncbi:MAG: hypothetical protein IT330_03695 [Anaerolineae bacterium]|nr:hypothetical protein [Anaerolineae bacterium]
MAHRTPADTSAAPARGTKPRVISRRQFLRLAGMAAWDQIFTLGQAPLEQMKVVCQQIEEAQRGAK